jgi:outer membrane lipoprotein-sorting protein
MTGGGQRRIKGRAILWWTEGPLSRPGARRRYTTMIVIVAILASLPAIVGALPVSAKSEPVATLLARVRASADIPYSGLASSSGQLQLPDLGLGVDTAALLQDTNRLRAWWSGPAHFRVDRVTAIGESDVYRDGIGVWTWDSGSAVAQYTANTPQFPLPGPQDALPPNLARRFLAEAPASELKANGVKRIVGRTALGLVWHPTDKRSTIGEVTVWVDEKTGLPLSTEARAVGGKSRAYSSTFLEFSTKPPTASQVSYHPSSDQTQGIESPQNGGPIDDNRAQFTLNPTLGGLKQRSPLQPLVATYGEGVSVVAVVYLDPQAAYQVRSQLDTASHPPISGAFGKGSLIETPLLNGLVFATNDAGYILIGTVTRAELEAMALDLVRHPAKPVDPNTVSGGTG